MFASKRRFLREAPTKAPSKAPNNPFKKDNAVSSSLLQFPSCTNPTSCSNTNSSSISKSSCPFLLRLFFYTCLSLLTLITILYIYTHYIHRISSAYDLNIKPKTPNQFISRDYDFLHNNKRKRRQKHFMNVDERIKIYMSNWYVKPCVENGNNVGVMKVDERLNYVYSNIHYHYYEHENENEHERERELERNNSTYYQIQFIDRNEEEMLLATMETKVLYDVPFVLQPNLIKSCALHNSININNYNNNISKFYFCQDAMHMINLIKNLDIEMDKSDAYSSSTIKTKALQIHEWNGDTHPLPIIVQFITTPSINNVTSINSSTGTSTPPLKNKHSISIIESYLMENQIPYIQEYRRATITSSTGKGAATHSRSKQSKAILNEVTNEKNLHCSIPGLRKHLHVQGEEQLSLSYYSPIVWFFNSKYHLDRLKYVIGVDIPWNWKRDDVVIVNVDDGNNNGGGGNTLNIMMAQQKKNTQLLNIPIHFEQDLNIPVASSSSSSSTTTHIMDDKQRIETMLQSKIIILPYTNTLQSMNELKWILYSRSILIMPPPSLTTFVMEERLEPYVHYIPLEEEEEDQNSNVNSKSKSNPKHLLNSIIQQIKWIFENPYKARKISEQGTLYIHDLFFHEDAYDDNEMIQFEILKRYTSFFVDAALV